MLLRGLTVPVHFLQVSCAQALPREVWRSWRYVTKHPALTSRLLTATFSDLPFGLIFAILMCSMMLGSQLYNYVIASATSTPAKNILIGTLGAASLCFFLPAYVREESITLWCFCIFEVCCGVYFPAMASLRGRLIEDGSRASVYTILRVPLNAFVVLALSTTQEGMSNATLTCSREHLLIISQASITATWYSQFAAGCLLWQRWSFIEF